MDKNELLPCSHEWHTYKHSKPNQGSYQMCIKCHNLLAPEESFPTPKHEAKKETMKKPLNDEFDAKVWAKEFMEIYENKKRSPMNHPDANWIDESLMLGWFANAIMAGYDHYARTHKLDRTKMLETLGRVYTYDKHSHKQMDSELMVDIADTLLNAFALSEKKLVPLDEEKVETVLNDCMDNTPYNPDSPDWLTDLLNAQVYAICSKFGQTESKKEEREYCPCGEDDCDGKGNMSPYRSKLLCAKHGVTTLPNRLCGYCELERLTDSQSKSMPSDELWDKCIAKSNIIWKIFVNPKGVVMLYPSRDARDIGYQGDAELPSFSGSSFQECLEELKKWLTIRGLLDRGVE